MKSVQITKSEEQLYQRGSIERHIIKPTIGCLLKRSPKPLKNMEGELHSKNELFVVYKIDYKKRGLNKGIVDSAFLERVSSSEDDKVFYDETDYPLCVTLTNHGNWFSGDQLKQYNFEWDSNISLKDETNTFNSKSNLTFPIDIPMIPVDKIKNVSHDPLILQPRSIDEKTTNARRSVTNRIHRHRNIISDKNDNVPDSKNEGINHQRRWSHPNQYSSVVINIVDDADDYRDRHKLYDPNKSTG